MLAIAEPVRVNKPPGPVVAASDRAAMTSISDLLNSTSKTLPHPGKGMVVRSLAFSPDGTRLCITHESGQVRRFRKGNIIPSLTGPLVLARFAWWTPIRGCASAYGLRPKIFHRLLFLISHIYHSSSPWSFPVDTWSWLQRVRSISSGVTKP